MGYAGRKWFATISICAALGGLAINLATAGPCLLQIRALSDSSIANIALIFPMMSVGRLTGSIPTGICRCNKWRGPVLGLLILMAAVFQAALPWFHHLLLLLASFYILGFADGYLDAESNNIIKSMWQGNDESFLVAARTSMIVGFAIGPFLSIPFVETPKPPLPEFCVREEVSVMVAYRDRCFHESVQPCEMLGQLSRILQPCAGPIDALTAAAGPSLTKLQTLYLITGVMLIILSLNVGISVWLVRDDISPVEEAEDYEPQAKMGFQWSTSMRLLACVLISIIAFCGNSINLSYIDFIATFVVIYLHRTARDGAYVTVLCCACAVVGSIVPIFLVRYVRATWLVGVCLVISTISGVLLASGAHILSITWIGSALLGISSFAIYALLFVLSDELLGLTNRISAMLVGVSAVGEIVMSFTAGRVFEPNPMNLMYILLAAFVTSDICYISVLVTSKMQLRTAVHEALETEELMNDTKQTYSDLGESSPPTP